MADLIDRQKAIDAIHYEYDDYCNIDESGSAIADDIERIIDNVPSAQPERKTGRWIQLTCDSAEWWYCSECNGRVQMNPWAKYNYCPNCGIRIKRGE